MQAWTLWRRVLAFSRLFLSQPLPPPPPSSRMSTGVVAKFDNNETNARVVVMASPSLCLCLTCTPGLQFCASHKPLVFRSGISRPEDRGIRSESEPSFHHCHPHQNSTGVPCRAWACAWVSKSCVFPRLVSCEIMYLNLLLLCRPRGLASVTCSCTLTCPSVKIILR